MKFSFWKFFCVLSSVLLLQTEQGYSQSNGKPTITGWMLDGSTSLPLSGVQVTVGQDTAVYSTRSDAAGRFFITLPQGNPTIAFTLPGFQRKVLTGNEALRRGGSRFDVILFPLFSKSISTDGSRDSLSAGDSVQVTALQKEGASPRYHPVLIRGAYADHLSNEEFGTQTERNALQVLKRLTGVVTTAGEGNDNYHSLNISGLGERYNQVLLNGAVMQSALPLGKAFPLQGLPAEALESVSMRAAGDASQPADFAGGSVEIRTADVPAKDFYFIQAGAQFHEGTVGSDFQRDKRNFWEGLGLPAGYRNLPGSFPTTRSRTTYNQKNLQERVDLARTLSGNLAPETSTATPLPRVMLGFGRNRLFRNGNRLGVVAYALHESAERAQENTVQVMPNVATASFPFVPNVRAVRSVAADVGNQYTANLSAVVNAAYLFGRNRIAWRNYFASSFASLYLNRYNLLKPDEDSLATAGVNVFTEQSVSLYSQLSGDHGLGTEGRLRVDWLASYSYQRRNNPDERNFLLRQRGGANDYEIATPQAPALDPGIVLTQELNFTNSGRLWRTSVDHGFVGALNIRVPFNLLGQPHRLSGGLYMQSESRTFYSDFFSYSGAGYQPLGSLLSPDRYYPGGLHFSSFYSNTNRFSNNGFLLPINRGNYTGSAYTAASYVQVDARLHRNLTFALGLRLESRNQLVSSSQYEYIEGYKNPQLVTIDENSDIVNFKLLPSAKLTYRPTAKLLVHGNYFKTVNRPLLQELTEYRYYDPQVFTVTSGSPTLLNSSVHNFGTGVSYLPNVNSVFSLSGFYKKIFEPIEYVLTPYATASGNTLSRPYNTPPAVVQGVQASFKVKANVFVSRPWLSALSFFGSATLLQSRVEAGPLRTTAVPQMEEHRLSGTPNYAVNGGVVWRQNRLPSVALIYNKTGDCIKILGSGPIRELPTGNRILSLPHYRMKGREQLDIQVSQRLFKERFVIAVGVNNLLSNSYVLYQDLDGNEKFEAPLVTVRRSGGDGFYKAGTDNTISYIRSQALYFINLSFLFP